MSLNWWHQVWKSCGCHLALPVFHFTQSCYDLEIEKNINLFFKKSFYQLGRQQKDWSLGKRAGCLLICELCFINKEEEELEVPLEGLGFQQQESRLCQQMKMATVAPSPEPVCWQVESVTSTNSGHVCTQGRSFPCFSGNKWLSEYQSVGIDLQASCNTYSPASLCLAFQ